jgi:molecular chaperone GrpE
MMIDEEFPKEGESTEVVEADSVSADTSIEAAEADEATRADQAAEAAEVKVVDKRRFARILGFGGTPKQTDETADGRRMPTYVAQLEDQLEQVRARAAQAESDSRSEIEAARQRLERHFEARLLTARADLVGSMLGVLDTLELALTAPGAADSPLFEGVTATRDLFIRQLAELGAEPVAALGEPFDPEVHEAVDEVAVEDVEADGSVVAELRKGFRLGERLVRPAAVRVGRVRHPPDASEQ